MFVVQQCVDTANTCGGGQSVLTTPLYCCVEWVLVVNVHCIYFDHVDSRSVGGVADGYLAR